MNGSDSHNRFGWRADSPELQDHNTISRQRSRSLGNLDSEKRWQGSGSQAPQETRQIRLRAQPAISDAQTSASSTGLTSRAGRLGPKPMDDACFHGGADGYEGRYDRLWRQGERHYLTSNISGDWDKAPYRNRAMSDANGDESIPSRFGSNQPENRAGKDIADIPSRKSDPGEPFSRNLQGTNDGSDACNTQFTAQPYPQPQDAPCADPSKEQRPSYEQIKCPPVAQGQPPGPEGTLSNPWPNEDEIDAKRQAHWHNAFARLNGIAPKNGEGSSTSVQTNKRKRFSPFTFFRRVPSRVSKNLEDLTVRRNFLLKLAKALLYFGAPPHRIESQLVAADATLNTKAEIVYLPNIVIVTMHGIEPEEAARTYFVRSKGRLALTSLHHVHLIYRDVLHDSMGAQDGIDGLRKILRAPPIYPLKFRCFLAFVCSSIICVLAFGGSAVDMFISGICASILQYLGLSAANKSSMYANVYEISVSIFVAFVARGLSSIPGHVFCYSAISSAGVVLILPGFTVLISSLELMSKNIFCGSVRIVYAIIYTLFLGFGLTIGSDFYLVLDQRARRQYYHNSLATNLTYTHGQFVFPNSTSHFNMVSGVIGAALHTNHTGDSSLKIIKGCLREDSWSWWRQPFPWYAIFILVPLYSTCSSLSNLQAWRSIQLPVMVCFSCAAYAANKATSISLPGRTDIVSAAGAFVIGLLGNIYSRVVRGTAFTSMVTGVLFLVPSGIAQGGGLNQNYRSSSEQYSIGFSLALRMISLASGVTVGLFVSQVLVYCFGSRKNGAHFAF